MRQHQRLQLIDELHDEGPGRLFEPFVVGRCFEVGKDPSVIAAPI